jgi:hypothetical protein
MQNTATAGKKAEVEVIKVLRKFETFQLASHQRRSFSDLIFTRLGVIFRYPDRVPLNHFVHRAKKVFGMWA